MARSGTSSWRFENDGRLLQQLRLSLFPMLCILDIVLTVDLASAQPGFVSVDCGSPTTFVDTSTGISYVADNYISTGSTATVNWPTRTGREEMNTLRYFSDNEAPNLRKSCYELPVAANAQYLVRAAFYHGGCAQLPESKVISFKLALDSLWWTEIYLDPTVKAFKDLEPFYEEAIVMTKQTNLSVCLVRSGSHSFINALELRPLPSTSYLGKHYSNPSDNVHFLHGIKRVNFGNRSIGCRYPDDMFDRVWQADKTDNENISAPLGQVFPSPPSPDEVTVAFDMPPDVVMRTAITHPDQLTYRFDGFNHSLYNFTYVSFFFAEVSTQGLNRIIDVSGNFIDNKMTISISSEPWIHEVMDASRVLPVTDNFITITVARNDLSLLGPLVNGFELYGVVEVQGNSPGTDAAQATIMAKLKISLKRDEWSGDPCLPVPWIGVNCSTNHDYQATVTEIHLPSQNLAGPIPNFSGLTSLRIVDLSSNMFTGPLPDWVATLPLDTLDVSNNQLTGTFPSTYTSRIKKFSYSHNLGLTCVPKQGVLCPAPQGVAPSKSSKGDGRSTSSASTIGAVVGGVLFLALVIGGVLYYRTSKKKKESSKVKISRPQSPLMSIPLTAADVQARPVYVAATTGKAQPFTLLSIKEATRNFATKIGEGGFGPVYHGILNNKQQVAVKVSSGITYQDFSELTTQIDRLSTVHYNKLVSLVGYCLEQSQLILLYEYLSGGDLQQRLYGSRALESVLNWKQRLHIALDAAKGLEYLHHGCDPAIFHRDVKSSNILLTEELEAKVADFGLSMLQDVNHRGVKTVVKGTVGYLDPEYNATGIVSSKRDVYSFGIVLLELLSGQPPIINDGTRNGTPIPIVDRVRAAMNTGNLQPVTDPGLRGDFNVESGWKLAKLAMRCVRMPGGSRPSMTKVVAELALLLESEYA